MSRIPADAAVRHDIVTGVDRSCFVEASAGTGKTRLMVERILEIVETGAAELDEIAAITFTEKAAGELRVRLRDVMGDRLESGLDGAGRPLDPERRVRLEAARGRLDRATVTTIHAFCTQILKERPIEAGITPGFSVADDVQARLLFDEAWEEWIAAELGDLDSPLAPVLAAGVRPSHLAALAIAMLAHRDVLDEYAAMAPEPPPDPPGDHETAWTRFGGAAATLEADVDRLLAACTKPMEDKACVAVRGARDLVARLARRTGPASDLPRHRVLSDIGFPKLGNSGRKGDWADGSLAELKALITQVIDAHADWSESYRTHLTVVAVRCMRGALAAYERRKAEQSKLDFEDLLLRTRDLLRADARACGDLAATWSRLLVDEFQDTDPVQVEIVSRLAAGTAVEVLGDLVRSGAGRLFVVGDPKQSIYRFRRADIRMYRRTVRALEDGGGARYVITENFRTRPSITDWVNRLFERLMPVGADDAHQPDYSPLTPFREEPSGDAGGIVRLDVNGLAPAGPDGKVKNLDAASRRREEARAVAALLRHGVAGGGWCVIDRDASGASRPARWSDVAILFRTFTPVEAYESAFRAADIPLRVDGGRYYFKRVEVQALLATLRAVDDPGDRVAIVAALRSPLFAFTDDEILIAAEAGLFGTGPARAATPPGLTAAVEQIRAWHGRRHVEGPTRIVEAVLNTTRAVELFALRPLGEQRVANLLKIVDEARTYESHAGGFRQFIRYLSEREAALEKERDSPAVEDDELGSVTMQSMHSAKGLEFPIVILADLAGRLTVSGSSALMSRGDDGSLQLGFRLGGLAGHRGATPGWDALEAEEALHADAELRRLFYVATTRPRDLLVLPIVALAGKASGLRELLSDADLDTLPRVGASRSEWPSEEPLFRHGLTLPAPTDPGVLAITQEIEAIRLAAAEHRRTLRAAWPPAPRRINPSRTAWGSAAAAAADRPASHPDDAGGVDGRPAGRAVHAALERVAVDGFDRAEQVRQALRENEVAAGEDAARVERLVRTAVAHDVWQRAVRSTRMIREAPILAAFEPPAPGGASIRIDGVIDLLFEEAGGLVLVDWKTDRAESAGWGAPAARHRAQLLGYLLAIEAAVPLPVTELVLVFLEEGVGESIRVDDALRAEARRLVLGAGISAG